MNADIAVIAERPPLEDDLAPDIGESYGAQPDEPTRAVEAPPEEDTQEYALKDAKTVQRMLDTGNASHEAFVNGQAEKYPHTVQHEKVCVYIFDLNEAEELAAFNAIKAKHVDPNFGLTIVSQEYKFSEKTDSWKVLIEVSYYVFLTI